MSGGTTKRPEYQRLLELIRSKRVDFIVSKEVSRLNRSTKDFCDLMDLCKVNGVAVHIRGLSVDPNNALSGALFQILAVIAELERSIIRERTRSSIRSAAKNNKKIHGGVALLGFDRDPSRVGFPLVNEAEIVQVIALMRHFNESLSYKSTLSFAEKQGIKNKNGNVLCRSSLKRLLSCQRYVGKMRVPDDHKEVWVDLPLGPVVPIELFEETQRNMSVVEAQFGRQNRNPLKIYVLTGILQFEDGTAFTGLYGKGRSGETHYYYWNKKHKLSIRALELEGAIMKALRLFETDEKMLVCASEIKKSAYSKVDFIERQYQDTVKAIKVLDAEETDLVGRLRSIDGAGKKVLQWLEGQLVGIEGRRNELMRTQRELGQERNRLSTFSVDAKQLKKSLKVVSDKLEVADPSVRRGILRQLIDKVTVFPDNRIEIRWKMPVCDSSGNRFDLREEWGG